METNDILVTQKGWLCLDLSAAIDLNEEAEGYSRKVLLSYLDNLWDDRYIPIKLNDAFEAYVKFTSQGREIHLFSEKGACSSLG